MARRKKTSKAFWWMLGGIVAVLAVFVFATSGGASVDYTQYAYTDAEVENPNATYVITEYSDFQCPYCGELAPVLKAVKADFDVRVEYKHFPLTQIHPYAQLAAEASECARDQGRFWAYHDVLFDNQDKLAKSYLTKHAEGLGLDTDQFEQCLDRREKQTLVAQDLLEGQRLNVRGTPTVYIDGALVGYRSYPEFAAHFSQ